MPSSKAVLRDLAELGLDPSKPHSYISHGRLAHPPAPTKVDVTAAVTRVYGAFAPQHTTVEEKAQQEVKLPELVEEKKVEQHVPVVEVKKFEEVVTPIETKKVEEKKQSKEVKKAEEPKVVKKVEKKVEAAKIEEKKVVQAKVEESSAPEKEETIAEKSSS